MILTLGNEQILKFFDRFFFCAYLFIFFNMKYFKTNIEQANTSKGYLKKKT